MPEDTPRFTVYVPPGPLGEGAVLAAAAGEKEDPTLAGLSEAAHANVYLHEIVPRPFSLLVFEMINVYVDAMRMFLRDCLPAPLGVSLDDQILSVMSPEERENLSRRLSEPDRQGVIHTIDTKHFPIVVGAFHVSLNKHFSGIDGHLDRMNKIHDFRNTVCHQSARDITRNHAERCYVAISEILSCTGPAEATQIVEGIWLRAERGQIGPSRDDQALSELQVIVDNAKVALSGVSELVLDIKNKEVSLVSNRRNVAPKRVARMLRIRIRRLTRTRRRHRP